MGVCGRWLGDWHKDLGNVQGYLILINVENGMPYSLQKVEISTWDSLYITIVSIFLTLLLREEILLPKFLLFPWAQTPMEVTHVPLGRHPPQDRNHCFRWYLLYSKINILIFFLQYLVCFMEPLCLQKVILIMKRTVAYTVYYSSVNLSTENQV